MLEHRLNFSPCQGHLLAVELASPPGLSVVLLGVVGGRHIYIAIGPCLVLKESSFFP